MYRKRSTPIMVRDSVVHVWVMVGKARDVPVYVLKPSTEIHDRRLLMLPYNGGIVLDMPRPDTRRFRYMYKRKRRVP